MSTLLPPVFLLIAAGLLGHARSRLRETALLPAWGWSFFALVLWGMAASLPFWANSMSLLMADAAWYLAAVATLCPGIAVLGSRRPVVRVWSWFVLLPLMLVFGAPVVTAGWSRGDATLLIAAPTTLGLGVVLLMGTGNYLGTRYSGPALCVAGAVLAVVGPMSELWGDGWSRESGRTCGAGLICLSLGWGSWLANRGRRSGELGWDRVWSDFRETFGVVWSRRVQDRINARATMEAWTCRLEPGGLVPVMHDHPGAVPATSNGADARPPTATSPLSPIDTDKLGQALRWHLDRFVSPAWIERRLPSGPSSSA